MTVQIIEKYIDLDVIDRINEKFSTHVKETPRDGILSALGWENASAASKIGFFENTPIDTDNNDLTLVIKKCLSEMRRFYEVSDLVLVNAFYTVMTPGSKIELHCDNCELDGSKLDPDVDVEPNEWSAILYLNNIEEDYMGGQISFPNQKLTYNPRKGDFLHFKTDVDHPHEVLEILSGSRKCLVIFTGRAETISTIDSKFSSR